MRPQARQPISTRHAFALAFDLAVRRDPVQSLWVPLLLHTPWLAMQAMLPAPDEPEGMTARNLLLNSVVLVGDALVTLLIAGMLRFRAQSVFNTPAGAAPADVLTCYARSIRRLPWLFATELLRNAAMFGAGLFLVLPGVWVGFRLSLATEAVVLREHTSFAAFGRSFELTEGRLERWLEMIAMSVVLALSVLFALAALFFAFPQTSWSTWVTVGLFLLPLVMTVIQYAWTFFFLRLDELDVEAADEPEDEAMGGGGGGGGLPRLKIVHGGRQEQTNRH